MRFTHINRWIAASICMALTLPVLCQGFDPEVATRAYLDTLQGAERERSNRYFEGGYWLLLWGVLVAILVDWVLLHTGLSARWRAFAERITKRTWLVPALYAIPYIVVSTLILLPWSLYVEYFREKHYGLMNLSLPDWLSEHAIGSLIGLILMALFLIVLFMVIRRSPKRWWMWGTGVTALFLMVGMVLAPVFISPLFNDYTPMEEGPLRDRILSMAEAYDVPADNIYVFDQSKQHDRISANVSGLFGTMRISLNDNLLNRSTPEEIEAVMGHELGHYVLNHIAISMLILTTIFGLGLYFISRAVPYLLRRYGEYWGIRDISDPAVLPVFGIALSFFFFLAQPAINTLIRVNESQADAFGLEAARQPDGFASIAMKLSEYRKIEPGALEEMLLFDHPSGRTRVRMAMNWKAANVDNPQMVEPKSD